MHRIPTISFHLKNSILKHILATARMVHWVATAHRELIMKDHFFLQSLVRLPSDSLPSSRYPPKNGLIALRSATNGSLFSITEITEYAYLSLIKTLAEITYKSDQNIVPLVRIIGPILFL